MKYILFPPAHLRPACCSDLRPRRGRRPLPLPERRLRLLVQTGLWTRFRRDLLLPARLDRKPRQRVRFVLSHPPCPASVRGAPFVGPSARVCRPRRAPQSALPRASVGPTARLSRPRRARPSAPPRVRRPHRARPSARCVAAALPRSHGCAAARRLRTALVAAVFQPLNRH